MDFSALVQAHGYWVLAVGCLLEGETVLLMAGFAAHMGLLNPWVVVAVASASGFAGDQVFFWLGRRHGALLLARFPALARRSARVGELLQRFSSAIVIGVRFAYGLRIAGPVLLGMSSISALRFTLLNACGALIWAVAVGGAGWVFGHTAQIVLGRALHVEQATALALAAVGILVWCWRRRRKAAIDRKT